MAEAAVSAKLLAYIVIRRHCYSDDQEGAIIGDEANYKERDGVRKAISQRLNRSVKNASGPFLLSLKQLKSVSAINRAWAKKRAEWERLIAADTAVWESISLTADEQQKKKKHKVPAAINHANDAIDTVQAEVDLLIAKLEKLPPSTNPKPPGGHDVQQQLLLQHQQLRAISHCRLRAIS